MYVPFKFLVAREVSAAAKVVYIVLRLDAGMTPEYLLSPTRLASRTGISRMTVRSTLTQLAQSRWGTMLDQAHVPTPERASDQASNQAANQASGRARDRQFGVHRSAPEVPIPAELVTDHAVDVKARVLYGILQGTPGFRQNQGRFKYADLGDMLQRDPRTVARAIRQLAAAGWLEFAQANRKARIHFTLRNPHLARSENMLPKIRRRLDRAPFGGEAIMREWLSLIVDSDQFQDDAAPGFLVNPLTDERLQFDRFYPPDVAFEFNGPQHYGATERFSAEDAARQRARDLIKIGICVTRGITLVVVHPEDLSLDAMKRKIVRLPLRDLYGFEPVINYLESRSRSYRRAARRRKW